VVRFEDDQWIVELPGAERSSFGNQGRRAAITEAVNILQQMGGGHVQVLNKQGSVEHVLRVRNPYPLRRS
jgi:hypothetical protein